MMLFCLPMPLMVVLRHRPLEAVIIATVINIVQSPSLSLLGLWYIVSLLALHYPLMDKAFGFTKMATVMFGAMIFSVVAYVVWVGRYIANPNYFFAPQLAILATLCMVLEDYTCATTQLANSAMAHEKKH
uniref:Membrane protein, putative n=2 Tax=Babesia bovis TaxID=5865 RepID=A7AMX5_BABBO|eukprot:XP_001611477.1 membrane protein [Babesia bovis T2Bo]